MSTFRKIQRLAIDGIHTVTRENMLQLWLRKEDGYTDLLFMDFRFSQNLDVREHLRLAQAVLDIAALMTAATRNDWLFRPQLIARGNLDCCYTLPVPLKHRRIVRQFTLWSP